MAEHKKSRGLFNTMQTDGAETMATQCKKCTMFIGEKINV